MAGAILLVLLGFSAFMQSWWWLLGGLVAAAIIPKKLGNRIPGAVFYIVPNMNPDGSVRGKLQAMAAGLASA